VRCPSFAPRLRRRPGGEGYHCSKSWNSFGSRGNHEPALSPHVVGTRTAGQVAGSLDTCLSAYGGVRRHKNSWAVCFVDGNVMELLRDLTYGFRMLRRTPVLSVAAILSLGPRHDGLSATAVNLTSSRTPRVPACRSASPTESRSREFRISVDIRVISSRRANCADCIAWYTGDETSALGGRAFCEEQRIVPAVRASAVVRAGRHCRPPRDHSE
jgi:hypothetical protein